jgi:hypothetical protein
MFGFTGEMPSVAEFAEEGTFWSFASAGSVSDPSHFCDGFRLFAPSPFAREEAFRRITERH